MLAPTAHAQEELWRVLTPLIHEVDAIAARLDERERAAVARLLGEVADLYRRFAAEH